MDNVNNVRLEDLPLPPSGKVLKFNTEDNKVEFFVTVTDQILIEHEDGMLELNVYGIYRKVIAEARMDGKRIRLECNKHFEEKDTEKEWNEFINKLKNLSIEDLYAMFAKQQRKIKL